MKNITLSIDEETLATVKRIAAEQDSSVSKLVHNYLSSIAEQEKRTKM